MADASETPLSRRERQIMDIVYRLGEATAVAVLEELPDDPDSKKKPTKTTVRTLLRILEEKGHLQHREEGLTYVYSPCCPREQAGHSAFQRVLRTFFDGSLEQAVAAHLSEEDVSPEELKRLLKLIREARQKED